MAIQHLYESINTIEGNIKFTLNTEFIFNTQYFSYYYHLLIIYCLAAIGNYLNNLSCYENIVVYNFKY